jgi:hypothetical protein
MKTFVTSLFLICVISLNAQSNWITQSFKSYLSNGNYGSFVSQATDELRNLRGSEEKEAYQVVELFKTLSGYSNNTMPICYYSIACNAVQIYPTSVTLKPNLYLYTFYIGGQYYFCLYNSDRSNMYSVDLSGSKRLSNGGYKTMTLSGGADKYSFKCIGRSTDNFNFSVTGFRISKSFSSSPCL